MTTPNAQLEECGVNVFARNLEADSRVKVEEQLELFPDPKTPTLRDVTSPARRLSINHLIGAIEVLAFVKINRFAYYGI
jgi:hypothetical protein